ncbi:MAG: hypothetical protein QXG05_06465 [Nitrososphaerota archaeon]
MGERLMNLGALFAILIFFLVLLGIFGAIYFSASKAIRHGEMPKDGLHVLKLAFLGHIVIFLLLIITAFLA